MGSAASFLHLASGNHRSLWILGGLLGWTLAGCAPPRATAPLSWGLGNHGALVQGQSLPDKGPGWVRARPGESTRFGTPALIGAIERAAGEVAKRFEGSAELRVGDLSAQLGGKHPRHGSHRSGRDADLIFYLVDAHGRSVRGRGWIAFDRFGVGVESHNPNGGAPTGDFYFFDDARNWHFVRTLLSDKQSDVQWIFCSWGVKRRLLAYARIHEKDPSLIHRASWVLHRSTTGRPHNDHFHVRVMCTPQERAQGCRNRGPVWPWHRTRHEKLNLDQNEIQNDELLVAELMRDESNFTASKP